MKRPRSRAEEKALFAKRGKPPRNPRKAPLPSQRVRLSHLDDPLQALLAPHFGPKADGAVQAGLQILRAAPPRTLRHRPEDVVAKVCSALRNLGNNDVVLAAKVVRAGLIEDGLEVLEGVAAEAGSLPFADSETREGFLAAVRHLRASVGSGVNPLAAIRGSRGIWGLDANEHIAFQQGVDIALERFQSRYGGPA